jgi:ATP-dependent protease ClpP protease subunit
MDHLQELMPRVWQVLQARTALRNKLPRPADDERRYLRVTNHTADSADVMVYDEIGGWGITALDFARELQNITAASINLRINSPGGDVFDSIAIYNSLRDHPAKIHVTVDSLAASGASVITMAGDTVTMNRGSQLMIHDAYTITIGNEDDLRETADLLGRISDTIAALYAARAGGDAGQWRDRMRAETWYSAAEAVSAGLADTDTAAGDTAAPAAAYDLSVFMFSGRLAAPAPQPVNAPSDPVTAHSVGTVPAPAVQPFHFDPETFRAAFQEALQ